MRDKKFILGAIVIVAIALVTLVVNILFSSTPVEEEAGNPFGDAENRPGLEEGDIPRTTTAPREQVYTDTENSAAAPLLRTLSDQPVAGAVTILKDGRQYARYVESATGHIKDVHLATIAAPTTLSGQTMPRVGFVDWTPDGVSTLLQRSDAAAMNIYSYLGTFASNTSTSVPEATPTMQGRHLADNIVSVSLSPDGQSVFYLVRTESGVVGYVENVLIETRRQVWSSPLTSLTAKWSSPSNIVVYTNPSSIAEGFVWLINAQSGASSVLLGDEHALSAHMSPDGTKMVYSMQEDNSNITSLRVLDIATGNILYPPMQADQVAVLNTISEKCSWDRSHPHLLYCAIPRNIATKDYLEDWYLGLLRSDDVLWQLNTNTGAWGRVLDPVELTTDSFDMVDLEISPDGDFITFRTRRDDLLWAARIPDGLVPQETMEPEEVTAL